MKDYVLKPFELLICKVPNDHKYDPPAKRRPVIILDPAYDAEDFEDKDFSLKDVYPIFIHGTSQVEKYKDIDDFLSFSLGELKGTNLAKPTGFFISDRRLKKNESKNWSAYDIIHNFDFQSLGVITDDMKKKIIDFVKERNIPLSLYESKQSTQEEDLYEEIYDFIEDLYDLRKESIAKDGEFGIGNLVFKEMRNLGYLDELKDLSKKLKSRQLSLERLSEQMVIDNAKRFFYELSKHIDVKFGEEYVILATNVDEHNEKKRDDNKDAYDNAVSYVENNGLRVSGYYLGDANPDTYIIERPNETTSEELADALAQDSFITFSFSKGKKLKTTSHDKKDEKDDRYSETYTTSNVIFDALAKSCDGYTLLPNGVAFSFGLYGNDEDERFKSLTEDKKEPMLKPNTPYMLRDDGKLLECGSVHPYIEMFKEASYEKNLNELLNRHSGFLDWFRENTKREDTASLVSKFESLEDKTNEEAKSLFEELSRKTDEEFCRVRTSNIKYAYGGDNGEIYFRIPVDSKVNWFDSIWKTVAENAPSIDYVTVVKDGPIVGKKQEYCSVGNEKLSHMPIDDFLTIEGNPTLN